MSQEEVAFLVYAPLRQRRADDSFDGNANIGAKVVADVLNRHGIAVGYCSPETASRYRLVLVSLTSTNDVFAFYKAVALLPEWQPGKRSFRVLAGGFGMQNPTAIRHYLDYAAFGRAHGWIAEVVDTILAGRDVSHDSVMRLPDISPVTISQGALYPELVEGFRESFTGCPLKCCFCHYTWARTHNDSDKASAGSYVQTSLSGGATPELTWDGLVAYDKKAGRLRVAIDGCSERLRYIYGKRISNDDIIVGVRRIGRFEGTTTLLVYNIGNMPTETDCDRKELYETLRQCEPSNRVIFVLQTTPFRPSPATPMQWEMASLSPDWSKQRTSVIVDKPNFRAVHSFTLETPWSHLCSLVAERATPDSDKLFHAICFAPGFHTGRDEHKVRMAYRMFDIPEYTRQYSIEEKHPTWFLSGPVDNTAIENVAKTIREKANASLDKWSRPAGSMVKSRLAKMGLMDVVAKDYAMAKTN
jgi:hypothetical protein